MLMKTLDDKMLVCKDTIKYNGKKNDLTFASSSHEVNRVQMLNLQATPEFKCIGIYAVANQ